MIASFTAASTSASSRSKNGARGMPEAQSLHRLFQRRHVILAGPLHAGDVEPVITRERLEDHGRVPNGARDRPAVIEGEGERHDASNRHQAVGGLETHGAAVRRGRANRAAGIRPERGVAERGRHRGGGTARRPARIPIQRPRVAHRTEVTGRGGAAGGELVKVGLANQHRTCLLQAAGHLGVLAGDAIVEHRAGRGGPDARGVDVVLERDGNAVERAANLAGTTLLVERPGFGQRAVGEDRDEGVQLGLVNRNARQARARRDPPSSPVRADSLAAASASDSHARASSCGVGGGSEGRAAGATACRFSAGPAAAAPAIDHANSRRFRSRITTSRGQAPPARISCTPCVRSATYRRSTGTGARGASARRRSRARHHRPRRR